MNSGNEKNNKIGSLQTLLRAAVTNVILWILSIVALIFIMQYSSSPKGLFVILAIGLFTGLTIITLLRKSNR
ncbi:hypothetical protein JXQ31_06020 [candidate division KSB1 bacterium]|nr:hypothetical protein [candidate division KSB1 bacterium]